MLAGAGLNIAGHTSTTATVDNSAGLVSAQGGVTLSASLLTNDAGRIDAGASTQITAGAADSVTYTRTSRTAAVCSSCHGTTLAAEHMTQNGAGFALTQLSIDGAQKSPFGPGAETCTLCHGAGQKFDPALFHGH